MISIWFTILTKNQKNLHSTTLCSYSLGAFTYDIRFLGRYVGQAASDFTEYAYVVNHLIRVGRSKILKKHLASYDNAPLDKTVKNRKFPKILTVLNSFQLFNI